MEKSWSDTAPYKSGFVTARGMLKAQSRKVTIVIDHAR
jgi:hypothetical protein